MKKYFNDDLRYLILFVILYVLLHRNFPYIEFIFLIPLLFYIENVKKVPKLLIAITIVIISQISFYNFIEYGAKFMRLTAYAHLLFYLPLILGFSYFIKNKYKIIIFPSIYSFLLIIFSFTIIDSFWANISGFLNTFPVIIQYCGSYLLSGLIVMINVILYELLRRRNIKLNLIFLIILIIIFSIPISKVSSAEKSIEILSVQTNFNQTWEERKENKYENFIVLKDITLKSLETTTQIVIWPEYTFPDELDTDDNLVERINEISKKYNVAIIVGSILKEPTKKDKFYDTLYVFEDNKISFFRSIEPAMFFSSEVIGADKNYPIAIKNTTPSFNICYEENLPKLISNDINTINSQYILSIGNQYQLTNKKGLEISSLNSHLRSAENNRYTIRLRTTGITKIIGNDGKTIREIPIGKENTLTYNIPLINKKTIYTKYGRIIEIMFSILILLLGLFHILSKRQKLI